jgi:GNAT superfamily N-acetyltransferase
MTDFDVYLESLVGSWEALAVPHDDAEVVRDQGFVASVFRRHPVFNNALLLDPCALGEVHNRYQDAASYAVWSGEPAAARALEDHGYQRDEKTYPMVCHLDGWGRGPADPGVRVESATVADIAALNHVAADLLLGVPGLRAFTTADREAGAVLIEAGSDVNLSFVATRPDRRRRGLASAVISWALAEARADGFRTSSLQATEMAYGVYQRLGYVCFGHCRIEPRIATLLYLSGHAKRTQFLGLIFRLAQAATFVKYPPTRNRESV